MTKLFIEPPMGLFEKVMGRIHKEQRLFNIKRRIVIFSIGLVGSLITSFPAIKFLSSEFIATGFIQFSSLLFSDFAIVTTYWQSFILTLLETLPTIGIIAFLITAFIFLESLKHLTKDIRYVFAVN